MKNLKYDLNSRSSAFTKLESLNVFFDYFYIFVLQVELTGSNISCYIHPEDHPDVMNVLAEARDELENAEHVPSGRYTDNIPFFGNQQGMFC